MKYLPLLLLSLISCNSEMSLEKGSGLHYLKEVTFELSNVAHVKWRVGRKKDKEVTQGFRFDIEIPKIDKQAIETLYKKYKIDSWIFKIIKSTKRTSRVVGYVQYDFKNFSSNVDSFSIKVMYHAAAVSKSFQRFHCPAFNHRFIINGFDFKDINKLDKALYTIQDRRIRRKISKTSFSIIGFSGGKSLTANFRSEVAFFRSKDKRVFGKFITSSNKIIVEGEDKVLLPSCIGIKEEITPLPESRMPGLKDFQIKK